ncbi:SAFB-like transcription modulator [Condylostylus longicornis]|uniref:SAFB-like transcription modulator n=1 Tax=Condylostylus longicornis TaxID=2530218 RepID=UPI00244DF6F5|nr:SAFB-like transcription modulator [Condylostylus longicornis]
MASEVIGRKLNELEIYDLRNELAKRKLDTFGSRNDLVERLKSALIEEGTDAEKFVFILSDKTEDKISNFSEVNKLPGINGIENIKTEILDIEDMTNVEVNEEELDTSYNFQFYYEEDNEESMSSNNAEELQNSFNEEDDQDDKEKIKNIINKIDVGRKKSRTKIVSNKRQIARLVELMKQNLDIGRGLISRPNAKKRWERFTVELNSLGPPKRNSEKWQRVWSDLKRKVKRKLNDNKEELMTNCGELNNCYQFSKTEEDVINILQLQVWVNPSGEIFGLDNKDTGKTSIAEEPENVTEFINIANNTESVLEEPETESEAERKKEITKVVSNKRQLVRLVELMEENLDIGRGIILKASAKKKWEEFAVELNSLGPPQRNYEKWQRVWNDLKFKVKKKINDNKDELNGSNCGSSKSHKYSETEQAIINILQLNPWSNSTMDIPSSNDEQKIPISVLDQTENASESNNFNAISTESVNEKFEFLPENSKVERSRHRKRHKTQIDQRLYLLKQQTDSQKLYQNGMLSILENIQKDLHSIEECIRESYYENIKYKKRKLELKQRKLDLLEQEIKNKEKYRKNQELYREAKLEMKEKKFTLVKNYSLHQHNLVREQSERYRSHSIEIELRKHERRIIEIRRWQRENHLARNREQLARERQRLENYKLNRIKMNRRKYEHEQIAWERLKLQRQRFNMAPDMSSETLGRKISELRACDLKDELAKRKLNCNGLKNELIERLQNAIKDEGKDPEKFLFPLLDKRGTKNLKKTEETEIQLSISAEEASAPEESEEKNESVVVDEVGSVDGDENDFQEQVDAAIENTNDNEESINLTIGEDEQKLLHEEEEQDEKEKPKGASIENSTKGEKLKEQESNAESKIKTEEKDQESQKEAHNGNDEKSQEKKSESENKVQQTNQEKEKTAESKIAENKTTASTTSAAKSHRNLWVSGLTSITRASDLKSIFSKYGKVIGAKVVTNTRTPGSRCYGYVTMGSSSEATRCIEHLHGTELHGRIISVERTKNEIGGNKAAHQRKEEEKQRRPSKESKRKIENDTSVKNSDDRNKDGKSKKTEKETSKDQDPEQVKSTKIDKKSPTKESVNDKKIEEKDTRHRSVKSSSRTSLERKKSRDRRIAEERERERRARERREREILSFKKIREERERQRLREKERELREEERRRREIRRRQREEEDRLVREREKLALERERLEREKAELLRLERERQKLEREKIELERLELKRQQMKIMEQNSRIEDKRPVKRTSDDRYGEIDRKRSTNDRRFEAPPPPRFDSSLATNSYDRSDKKRDDYGSNSKRDDYVSSKRDDYIGSKRDEYSKREDYSSKRSSDIVVPPPPPRHSSGYHSSHGGRETHGASHKTSRYIESEVRPISYRAGRSPDRNDPRTTSNKRYDVSSSYSERTNSTTASISGTAPWHSGNNQPIKSFASSSMPTSSNVGVWPNKSNEDHWGRPIDAQDRYDRTYNERVGYGVESPRSAAMFGGRPDSRYSGQISSRYENGKY